MTKFINNISLSRPTRFDQDEWNYLRYEITRISGGRYFKSASRWELWIWNNGLNDTENIRKIFKKDYVMKRKLKIKRSRRNIASMKNMFVLGKKERKEEMRGRREKEEIREEKRGKRNSVKKSKSNCRQKESVYLDGRRIEISV